MRITKYGHACLLVEEQEARFIIDPGSFSKDLSEIENLDAILVTHDHADHVDPDTVKQLLEANPTTKIYADKGGVHVLGEAGIEAETVAAGQEIDVKGVRVEVFGEFHDPIHRDLPPMGNVGYLIAGRLFYPGDALTVPTAAVEILALPVGGPWMKLEEGIDYLKEIKPKVAIPVHDALYARPGMFNRIFEQTADQIGAVVRVIDDGKPIDL
jgi:L-ascorbate metabolism protein UlaG (beta-lactamase superfamily)